MNNQDIENMQELESEMLHGTSVACMTVPNKFKLLDHHIERAKKLAETFLGLTDEDQEWVQFLPETTPETFLE